MKIPVFALFLAASTASVCLAQTGPQRGFQTPASPNRFPAYPQVPGAQSPEPSFLGFYPVLTDSSVLRTKIAALTNADTRNQYPSVDAILVGFEITMLPAGSSGFSSITPIYETAGDRKPGVTIGTPQGNPLLIVAKPGYALTALEIWPSMVLMPKPGKPPGLVEGFCGARARFGKLENSTISKTEQYVSPLVGVERPNTVLLDTNGIPACGVTATYDSTPCRLGLLVSKRALMPGAPQHSPDSISAYGGTVPSTTRFADLAAAREAAAREAAARNAAEDSLRAERDPRIAELTSLASKSFAFVQGDTGKGSAFVANYQGRRKVISNQHVVRENPSLKFTLINQNIPRLGAAHAAVGHDIIMLDTEEQIPALEIELDCAANVAIGDDVIVVGNTGGAGSHPDLARQNRGHRAKSAGGNLSV